MIVLAAVNAWLMRFNQPVDMNLRRFGYLPVFYLAAFAGIGGAVALSRLLPRLPALEWLGRNSLVILVCHVPAGSLVANAIGRRLWRQPFTSWTAMLISSAFHAAVAIAICVPLSLAVNRWFPWVLGKPRSATRDCCRSETRD